MRVSELALKSDSVVDLDIPFSGLYLLAPPSTPSRAREAVFEAAAAGDSRVNTKYASPESSGLTVKVDQKQTEKVVLVVE